MSAVAQPGQTRERYAAGLYRVSTAEQGQSGLGLESQQASMRAFVAAQGWTLVAEFSDIASGKDDRRPGFLAALTRCRQPGAVLAAARLDRITRRAHTLSQLLEDGHSIRAADMPGGGRSDDAGLRGDGAEGARTDQRAHPGGAGGGQGAWRASGRGPGGHRPAVGPDSGAARWRSTGCCWRWTGCGRRASPRCRRWRGH